MVTGSVAGIAYGEPRLTHDIDIVVEMDRVQAGLLLLGFPEPDFYCPPAEIIRLELERDIGGHFNIIHQATGFKADVYPVGQDPLSAWGLARRRKVPIGEIPVPLAPPEYVIARKLEYFQEGGSEKHLRDIRSMLKVSGDLIEHTELARLVRERHLDRGWQRVQELPL
jgi:hypothetical protein